MRCICCFLFTKIDDFNYNFTTLFEPQDPPYFNTFYTIERKFQVVSALGIDQRIIDYFMGHQIEEMHRRHQHLFSAFRRKEIDSLTY